MLSECPAFTRKVTWLHQRSGQAVRALALPSVVGQVHCDARDCSASKHLPVHWSSKDYCTLRDLGFVVSGRHRPRCYRPRLLATWNKGAHQGPTVVGDAQCEPVTVLAGTVPGLKDNQLEEVKRLIRAYSRLQTLLNWTPFEVNCSMWLIGATRQN